MMKILRYQAVLGLCLFALAAARPADAQELSQDDFFDDNSVQEIRLLLNSKDWAALKANFESNTYYATQLTWRGQTVRNVGIRSRGRGSRRGTKPGLRVDFDRYSVQQTFLGMKSFVLDNLTQDASMVKERVAMQFFRRMGIPAPRETHARLFVNDQFVGLYAAVESIDKAYLGRAFGEDDHGGVENDGYLFEYDYLRDYHFEYLGGDLAQYAMFKPSTREKDPASRIWEPIEKMVKAINDAPSSRFVQDVSPYLDLNRFVTHIAVENFLAEWDGVLGYAGLNNFYFYRFENSTRGQFLPWDKDNTFRELEYPIMQGVADNVLSRRALEVPQLRGAYLDVLLNAAASAEETDADAPDGDEVDDEGEKKPKRGWLERELLREYEQIRAAARADTFKAYTNDEFEEEYQRLLAFARARSKFVRDEVRKLRR